MLRAVVRELRALGEHAPADPLELAVEHAYFEGMLAAFDECERCCGVHSRAREVVNQVRLLVEGRRGIGDATRAEGGGR